MFLFPSVVFSHRFRPFLCIRYPPVSLGTYMALSHYTVQLYASRLCTLRLLSAMSVTTPRIVLFSARNYFTFLYKTFLPMLPRCDPERDFRRSDLALATLTTTWACPPCYTTCRGFGTSTRLRLDDSIGRYIISTGLAIGYSSLLPLLHVSPVWR
jgi:hypothetical protein